MNIFSPLEQFQITTLIPLHFLHYNISFTNGTLFLILTIATIFKIEYAGVLLLTLLKASSLELIELDMIL